MIIMAKTSNVNMLAGGHSETAGRMNPARLIESSVLLPGLWCLEFAPGCYNLFEAGANDMADNIDDTLALWIRGKDPLHARRSAYQKIRDIPYAVVPELNHPQTCVEIFKTGRGSCMPKHLLLGRMFGKLGLTVLYVVFPFRWDEARIEYPDDLRKLAEKMPPSHHLGCRVEIEGQLVLVDATLDSALAKLSLPVNLEWDGLSDTLLPIDPCGEEELYHPSEAALIEPRHYDENSLEFFRSLNLWLERVRSQNAR
jgi:hypothetical protein